MKNSPLFAALFLALPLAAGAQTKTTPAPKTTTTTAATKPAPGTQQVTEVTEELDPETGKVIRRTTRTTTVPIGTPAPASSSSASKTTTTTVADSNETRATDSQVSDFFREKTAVASLNSAQLVDAYARFIEKVREDRREWKPADWNKASAVLSSLNARYEQLRSTLSLDDKVTIRSQQAEYQALRTARQISKDVSEKL